MKIFGNFLARLVEEDKRGNIHNLTSHKRGRIEVNEAGNEYNGPLTKYLPVGVVVSLINGALSQVE
jgi:hypothetical protein